MAPVAVTFHDSLAELVQAATATGTAAREARDLTDADLMSAQQTLAEAKRHVDTCVAMLAGETVRRSSLEAGFDGLARKQGFRTAEALVRGLTGSTAREANTLVRVGTVLNSLDVVATSDGDVAPPAFEPWLVAVGEAVIAGILSVAAADAVRTGLGRPGPGVNADELGVAAAELVESIAAPAGAGVGVRPGIDAETVLRMARDARDSLDANGIAERERQRRSLRTFRRWRSPEGMTHYTWRLDPEGAALVDDIYDKITSPRRGGPRFLSDTDRARAEAIEHDDRTTDQLASDGFLELLQLAFDTDPTTVVGALQPAVRVLVSAHDLANRSGRGWIEGQNDPVSIPTVERHICRGGIDTIVLDGALQPATLGRTQRTFNRAQRRLLSARDGGCRWPGCERPPEWTEAHHIRWWDRDRGRTDIDNGILLCRHHHLLLHDNGWEIRTTRGGPPGPTATQYWLVPPPDIDHSREPRPMPSKSRALHDAHRHRQPVPA